MLFFRYFRWSSVGFQALDSALDGNTVCLSNYYKVSRGWWCHIRWWCCTQGPRDSLEAPTKTATLMAIHLWPAQSARGSWRECKTGPKTNKSIKDLRNSRTAETRLGIQGHLVCTTGLVAVFNKQWLNGFEIIGTCSTTRCTHQLIHNALWIRIRQNLNWYILVWLVWRDGCGNDVFGALLDSDGFVFAWHECCNVGIPDMLRVNLTYSNPQVGKAYPWHAEFRGKVADV